MNLFRTGALVGSFVLVGFSAELLAKEKMQYRLVFEESLRSVWQTELTPTVTISSTTRIKLHDKVNGKDLSLSRSAVPLGVDDNNMADFCIDAPKEPICREVIISDFSYEGLEGVLLGNRGERLKYIVVAECKRGDRSCRYPHLKLGPNPIFQLLKKGIRVHLLQEKGNDLIVSGPYPKDKAVFILPHVKKLLPNAFIR